MIKQRARLHWISFNAVYKFLQAVLLAIFLQTTTTAVFAYTKNNEHYFTVKRGDSLSKYFAKLGLSNRLLANLLAANQQNRQLNNLHVGDKIIIRLHNSKRFKSLSYRSVNKTQLKVVLLGTRFVSIFKTSRKNAPPLTVNAITISRSFGYDAQRAGLSFKAINTVVKALSPKLNFNSALHKGDRFLIISNHAKKLVGIVYKSGNKRIEAFAYTDKNGRTHYYNRHGEALATSFLRAPLKYRRVSSKFQLKRFHPTLKVYRPHRAVDYAAKRGTPVWSTANGIIQHRGRKGPLGKSIMIKHGTDYVTVYAHLSRYAKKLRKGSKVRKGQVIGYVGSTGRSTGPHLHYELRHKGKRRNPLTYPLPKQKKIPAADLPRFKSHVNAILRRL